MLDRDASAFRESLAGGGACGALIAARDWGQSALGPLDAWPAGLRTALSLVLRSPVPMVMLWGADGVMLYNDPYSRFAGGRHPELLGSKVREGWAEVAGFNDNVMRTVLAGGTLQYRDQELTLHRPGRPERVWMNLDYSPVLDEAGRPAGVLCVLAETTDRIAAERLREAAEAALAESEAQFRLMVDTVPQIIWITDADGRMEFLNHRFSRYTGAPYSAMSPDEIAAAFIHPEDAPKVVEAFEAARDGERPHLSEHRIRSGAGEYRWFLDRAAPYRDLRTGRITRWFGASVDIHDRKLAEEALRDLNENLEKRVAERTAERNLLATLVENTDIMVLAIDLDFTILALNAANADEFERIFGARPKPGDNMLALLADRPELQAEVRAGWARGMAGESVDFIEDFGDPDRARPYYEIKFRPLRDEAGRQVGVYQFVTDVTDRLSREAKLVEAQVALRQSQKMEAIGQLTGGVAHDFNNLLMAVLGNLDLLRRNHADDPRAARLIDGAMQGARRGAALTQRLLAFARRQELAVEPRDVGELLAGMTGLLEQSLGPVELRLDIADPAPVALVDANQLELAVLNLAVNARDAMPGGGVVTVRVDRAAGEGDLAPGDYVRLTVSDTGHGMDAETLKRAAEPFFSTKGVGKGTGLGLSMIHGLAVQLRGALRLSSRPGEGTRAELWLPGAGRGEGPREAAPAASVAPIRAERASRARILVVDDDPLIAMSTVDMLEDLGHEVVEANSGAAALDILRDGGAFDLLVTDFAMPRMNGAELAEAARALRPGLPILLATGYAELPAGERLGLPRLAKPYDQDQLAAELAKLLAV